IISVPPASTSMSMRVLPASTLFSSSSLRTDAGRSMTSPAAILVITECGSCWIRGIKGSTKANKHGDSPTPFAAFCPFLFRCASGTLGHQHPAANGVGILGVVVQELGKLLADCVGHKRFDLNIVEPGSCLTLELRFPQLHVHDRDQPLTAIGASDLILQP